MATRATIHSAVTFQFTRGQKVFIDANVWRFVIPVWQTNDSGSYGSDYREVFRRLDASGATIHTNVLVLNELIGSLKADAFKHYFQDDRGKLPSKKAFYQSLAFEPYASRIGQGVSVILDKALLGRVAAPNNLLRSACDTFRKGPERTNAGLSPWDFGDHVYACTYSKDSGFFILSDDKDFAAFDINLITLNRWLLKERDSLVPPP